MTVSEAIWKARPFIGGDVGGIPLQIEDGVTGYLVSSAEQCAERTMEILEDPALGKSLGRRGKEHVREHFLTPRYLRDYLKIFNELRVMSARRGVVRERGVSAGVLRAGGLAGVLRERRCLSACPCERSGCERGAGAADSAGAGVQSGAGHLPPRRRDPARLGRAGHGAHGAGIASRSDLDRLGDERARRRGLARARGTVIPGALPRRGRVPGAPRRLRPRGVRPLLQRLRQPDAVVHPALPVGPLQRPGHPPRGDRGVRVRLQRRQRGPRARGRRGARGSVESRS